MGVPATSGRGGEPSLERGAKLAGSESGETPSKIFTLTTHAGSRLKDSGETISHASDKITARAVSNDFRVDQHQIRVAGKAVESVVNATMIIDDADGAAGRIGRCNGRKSDEGSAQRCSCRPGGVEHFAATGGQKCCRSGLLGQFPHLLNGRNRAFTGEEVHAEWNPDSAQNALPLRCQSLGHCRAGDDEQRPGKPEKGHFTRKSLDRFEALRVAGRRGKHSLQGTVLGEKDHLLFVVVPESRSSVKALPRCRAVLACFDRSVWSRLSA